MCVCLLIDRRAWRFLTCCFGYSFFLSLGVASLPCILDHHLAALLTVSCFGFFSSTFRQVVEGSRRGEVFCSLFLSSHHICTHKNIIPPPSTPCAFFASFQHSFGVLGYVAAPKRPSSYLLRPKKKSKGGSCHPVPAVGWYRKGFNVFGGYRRAGYSAWKKSGVLS